MRKLVHTVLIAAVIFAAGEVSAQGPAAGGSKPFHERREVIEAVKSLSQGFARINRKYVIGSTAPKILGLEYIESVGWNVRLEGLFHFEHLETVASGRWACLYLSDEDLAPLDLALFTEEKEPDWTKCPR